MSYENPKTIRVLHLKISFIKNSSVFFKFGCEIQ